MSDAGVLFLINAETGERFGPLTGSKGDIDFPEVVRGWGDVLDCRHVPYTEKSIEELRHFTHHHIHKHFMLIDDNHISFRFAEKAEVVEG